MTPNIKSGEYEYSKEIFFVVASVLEMNVYKLTI